ncbi:hypothetical protein ACHWQZ_G010443 [Mnemiopsis leidyi]
MMKIKTLVALLCIIATTLIVLSESGILMPSEQQDVVKMDTDDYIQLINKVCNVPEGQPRGTQLSDKCFLNLFFLHEDEGIKSSKLYDEINHWSNKMVEKEGDDTLTGHSYYSKEMINFKMSYSYQNYLEPVLQEANNFAAKNAKHLAAKTFAVAAIVSIISLIVCKITQPDNFALPMPNFYETSKTQRNSPLFEKLQKYFHGPTPPRTLDLPMPGGYKKKKKIFTQ